MRRGPLSSLAAQLNSVHKPVISILPLGELLLRPLEAQFPPLAAPERVDGIVVLGGVEDPRATELWGQLQINQAAERLTVAAALGSPADFLGWQRPAS